MQSPKYNRILLKLSGEALMGEREFGIDPAKMKEYASEIADVCRLGVETAIVIGGGNIFRGVQGEKQGMDRVQSDQMGMLATVINSLALQAALEKEKIETRVLSAVEIKSVCEPFIRRRAIRHLEKKRVIILAGGTGNPYFTTDTAASLRALELQADVVIKATRVDGVYDVDPEVHDSAVKYDRVTFAEVLDQRLGVMDMTAFTLSEENELPIIVFNMNIKGNLLKILQGEEVGTLVS